MGFLGFLGFLKKPKKPRFFKTQFYSPGKNWDLDLMQETLLSVIELLMIAISYRYSVLTAAQWILLKHLSAELEPETAKLY